MWLAISSIVLASAIGFNVLALLLTGMVREVSGEIPVPLRAEPPKRRLGTPYRPATHSSAL
jgi:hypothetical protein